MTSRLLKISAEFENGRSLTFFPLGKEKFNIIVVKWNFSLSFCVENVFERRQNVHYLI